MIPELEQYTLEHWSELGFPGPPPGRLRILQMAGLGSYAAKILFFISVPGARRPIAIAKTVRFPEYSDLLTHEVGVLSKLSQQLPERLVQTLPQALAELDVGPNRVVLYRAVAADSLKHRLARPWLVGRTRLLREAARASVRWISDFHRATRNRDVVLEDSVLRKEVSEPLERYRQELMGAAEGAPARALAQQVSAALCGKRTFLAQRHGDFWVGNVLRCGDQLTVVDWELSKPDSLCVGDPIFYLCSLAGESIFARGSLVTPTVAFEQIWLRPTRLRTLVADFLADYARATGHSPEVLVWYLPVVLASEALRKASAAQGGPWDDRWHKFLQLLLADPSPLTELQREIGNRLGDR